MQHRVPSPADPTSHSRDHKCLGQSIRTRNFFNDFHFFAFSNCCLVKMNNDWSLSDITAKHDFHIQYGLLPLWNRSVAIIWGDGLQNSWGYERAFCVFASTVRALCHASFIGPTGVCVAVAVAVAVMCVCATRRGFRARGATAHRQPLGIKLIWVHSCRCPWENELHGLQWTHTHTHKAHRPDVRHRRTYWFNRTDPKHNAKTNYYSTIDIERRMGNKKICEPRWYSFLWKC